MKTKNRSMVSNHLKQPTWNLSAFTLLEFNTHNTPLVWNSYAGSSPFQAIRSSHKNSSFPFSLGMIGTKDSNNPNNPRTSPSRRPGKLGSREKLCSQNHCLGCRPE